MERFGFVWEVEIDNDCLFRVICGKLRSSIFGISHIISVIKYSTL